MKNVLLTCSYCIITWHSYLQGGHTFEKKITKGVQSGLLASDMRLEDGTDYNDSMNYPAAIDELNIAIQLNPSNREAYIERAYAYFELGDFENALDDYYAAEKLKPVLGIVRK